MKCGAADAKRPIKLNYSSKIRHRDKRTQFQAKYTVCAIEYLYVIWNWNRAKQPVDRAGSSIQGTESLNLGFSPGSSSSGMLLGNGGQPAKCKIILCSPLACACDKSKCRRTISALLTLYSHPTVDIGSGPNDVGHNLLSCQVHLRLSAVEIHPLVIRACENRSAESTELQY